MVPRGAVYCLAIKRIDMSFFIVDLANNRWQSLIELQGEADNDGDANAVRRRQWEIRELNNS